MISAHHGQRGLVTIVARDIAVEDPIRVRRHVLRHVRLWPVEVRRYVGCRSAMQADRFPGPAQHSRYLDTQPVHGTQVDRIGVRLTAWEQPIGYKRSCGQKYTHQQGQHPCPPHRTVHNLRPRSGPQKVADSVPVRSAPWRRIPILVRHMAGTYLGRGLVGTCRSALIDIHTKLYARRLVWAHAPRLPERHPVRACLAKGFYSPVRGCTVRAWADASAQARTLAHDRGAPWQRCPRTLARGSGLCSITAKWTLGPPPEWWSR